ncbi:MAG: hypothetical protein EPO21_24415 [Chloroflexota bacterium]|nr:MAG: hypothetical protein EPO21_24415 [Chloroflexota bacterium]
MKCPTCSIELKMADRQGIEIDYCPQCRGIWLDRGELDKIIERSTMASTRGYKSEDSHEPWRRGREDDRHEQDGYEWKKRKRGSFLEEIFDF